MLTNVQRLRRDGRRTPEYYRNVARQISSPSKLSIDSITESYDAPSEQFGSIDDVYAHRGYRKLARLDEGAFGIVYKGVRLIDNLPVAIKEVDLSRRRAKRIDEMKRELFVMQKVESRNIVRLIEHFIGGHTLAIIMELCTGKNLTHHLKRASLTEEECLHLFRQMAHGLRLMHKQGIAHRDVKLNNFLLDGSRKTIKVADFGLSVVSFRRATGILMCKTYCGTEPYMAPEILRRNVRGFRQYNPMYADVWALGVCLYAMLTRTFPFRTNLSQRSLFRTQFARRWRIPRTLREKMSEELKDLLWHMLDPEPDRRITMNGVMAHPWLNSDMVALELEDS